VQLEAPFHGIREERPRSSPSFGLVAAAVVLAEEAGCTQDAESEEEVFVVGAAEGHAAAAAAVAGIAVPSHREALSH